MIWIFLLALLLALVLFKLGVYTVWVALLKITLQVMIFVATGFGLLLLLRRIIARQRLQRRL